MPRNVSQATRSRELTPAKPADAFQSYAGCWSTPSSRDCRCVSSTRTSPTKRGPAWTTSLKATTRRLGRGLLRSRRSPNRSQCASSDGSSRYSTYPAPCRTPIVPADVAVDARKPVRRFAARGMVPRCPAYGRAPRERRERCREARPVDCQQKSPTPRGIGLFLYIWPGGNLLSRTQLHTIIGANPFHGPVRDGKAWVQAAIAARLTWGSPLEREFPHSARAAIRNEVKLGARLRCARSTGCAASAKRTEH